jgi:hypothetical protein
LFRVIFCRYESWFGSVGWFVVVIFGSDDDDDEDDINIFQRDSLKKILINLSKKLTRQEVNRNFIFKESNPSGSMNFQVSNLIFWILSTKYVKMGINSRSMN